MNKKIFATAILALAAFVSTTASAQVTYTNSVASGSDFQNANAQAAISGGAVRANDLLLTFGTNTKADDDIIVRLPAGFNFEGSPSYMVSRAGGATATVGLTLKDNTEFGDPTLDDPKITLSDTNGDLLMDRALVTVSSDTVAGDELVISLTVRAGPTVVKGNGKKASVIVAGNLAVTQEIADAVTSLATPVSGSATGQGTVDQNGIQNLVTSGAPFVVTIPAGTAGGTSLTLTPGTSLAWATAGSAISWTIHTPGFSVDALTPTSASTVVGPASATTAVTLKTNWASTATNDSAIQVRFTVGSMNAAATTSIGLKNIAVGGVVTGNAAVVDVKANGSEATLSATPKAPNIVAGSSTPQILPTIDVEENFDTDLGGSFTITAGTGLTFSSTGSIVATGITGTLSLNALSTVITVTPAAGNGASDTISISGITAVASATAAGTLTVTVDSSATVAPFGPKSDVLSVAVAVPVGVVELSLSGSKADVGSDNYAATSTVKLKETTYGALTIVNATQVNDAFFRITPSGNAEITAVTTSDTGYAAGTSPTITACVAETGVTTGAFLCEITAESTAVVAGTSTISVAITYNTDEASVGDTVDMVFDGNSGVAGTVSVADVQISTTASVPGLISDIATGASTAKTLATLEIEENFDNAITAGGFFRLVAPAGVAFQDAAGTKNASIGTPTITATFSPNDTLVVPVILTQTLTITPKAVIANGQSGLISFDLFDGDIDGLNKAGVTAEEVTLVHAGELPDLDAGDDQSVNVGYTKSNAITGGLMPYKVASSQSGVGSVTLSGDTTAVVKGVSAGDTTITVTDSLNAPYTYDVTVAAGAAKPAAKAPKGIGGDVSDATFAGGASADGGATYADTFTTADDVTLIVDINVATGDQGSDGEIHIVVLSIDSAGNSTLAFLNEDGNFDDWDLTIEGLGAAEVATPLAATHTITVYSGQLAAGTHRVAAAYSTADGNLVYTGKALSITVTE